MEKISYEKAISKLEAIVNKMEDGDMDLELMTTELKKAQDLIKFCKAKLLKTDAEIEKLIGKK